MGDSVQSETEPPPPQGQQADPTVTAGTPRGGPAQPAISRPAVAPSSGIPRLPKPTHSSNQSERAV